MKKMIIAAAIVAGLTPLIGAAQSVFDGTWKTDPGKVSFSTKPVEFSIKDGSYQCLTCEVKTKIKADGTDQKVEGSPYVDTIAVKIVDPNTLESVSKKAGKEVGSAKRIVAADGKSMTLEYKSMSSNNAEVVSGKTSYKRVKKGAAGSHAVSGSWLPTKIDSRSDNGMTVTFKSDGKVMNMSTVTGESYSAKLDGTDAPVKGDPGVSTVAVKMLGKNVMEEVIKRDGKVISVDKTTVSADGKTATVNWENKVQGTKGSYVMVKQ